MKNRRIVTYRLPPPSTHDLRNEEFEKRKTSCFPSHGHGISSASLPEFLETHETKSRRNVSFRVSSHLHHSLQASNLFLLHILHSPIHHKHYHVSILLFPLLLTLESVSVT